MADWPHQLSEADIPLSAKYSQSGGVVRRTGGAKCSG